VLTAQDTLLSDPTDPASILIHPTKPLLIVDVDEVLSRFMHGFAQFVAERGYELRFDRFALFQNLYRPGESEHLDLTTGRALANDYYETGSEYMEPVPHAIESLNELSKDAGVVVLTNAPAQAREPRGRWLRKHGIDFPLIINEGAKGGVVAALAARTRGPAAFVDDLLHNLDSAAAAAPAVHRFQLVADERLRHLAPTSTRHRRIDHWPTLAAELSGVLNPKPR
jgi:hypothetical protein